jgi:hypothetical protein
MRLDLQLGLVGQLLEQPIPIGNVSCVPGFQSPENQFRRSRVAAGSLERLDHLALLGNVAFPAVQEDFGFPKKLLQTLLVHAQAYPLARPGSHTLRNRTSAMTESFHRTFRALVALASAAAAIALAARSAAQEALSADPATRCAQLIAFWQRHAGSKSEGSGGGDIARKNAELDCGAGRYQSGIQTMEDLLRRNGYTVPPSR